MSVYATIVIELSKAGLHAICDDIDEDVFCVDGNLDPLVKLINDAEACCNPETVFVLGEEGKKCVEQLKAEGNEGKRHEGSGRDQK